LDSLLGLVLDGQLDRMLAELLDEPLVWVLRRWFRRALDRLLGKLLGKMLVRLLGKVPGKPFDELLEQRLRKGVGSAMSKSQCRMVEPARAESVAPPLTEVPEGDSPSPSTSLGTRRGQSPDFGQARRER
jgi:hypothetical protein